MQYLFLVLVVILVTAQDIAKKQYNVKVERSNGFIFSAITTFFAMLLFVATTGFKFNFDPAVLPYSIAFAIACASALVALFLAVKWGPLSITLLVVSYSLLIPTFYGIIFLGDSLSPFRIIGLVLLAISILLISRMLEKKKEGEKVQPFSVKWLIALLVAFVGNGMCSTIQKMQNLAFTDPVSGEIACKNEFMIVAYVIAFVILVIASISNKEDIRVGTLPCFGFGALTGIANGLVNYLVMLLTPIMDTSILFPSISGGGIVLGFVLSIFLYKERLSVIQYIGYAIGAVSVVLLNM